MKRMFSKSCMAVALLVSVAGMLDAVVFMEEEAGLLEVTICGKPVLGYQSATVEPPEGIDSLYAGSGFIHPLYSPSGKILTDPFPVGHTHQHGLFSSWTRTTFHGENVDFWNKHRGTGFFEGVSVEEKAPSSFVAKRRLVSVRDGPAINETWKVTLHDRSDVFIVDIVTRQTLATDEPVEVREFIYGGFAFRGSANWNSEGDPTYQERMQVLTGKGTTDIEKANHERPGWVAAYGSIGDSIAGVVIMDHPTNFRHPQPVRIHPVMPYFVFSPPVLGSFSLEPDSVYEARYRIITFDGKPDRRQIEGWFRDYAKCP